MDRFKVTKKVGIIGIIGNIFLLVIKAVVGIIAKSQSMIADAANSASDIFASTMTAIGNKIASEPSDEDHNFGHGKAEYIFSLMISISMIVLSLKILYDSAFSVINKNIADFSWPLIVVCAITIITKLALYFYTRVVSKKVHNILIEANMKDHRNDCIVTSFTLLSIILGMFKIYWVDGIVGIGISIWIFYTGAKIFIDSYNVLMDRSIDENTKEKISECIKSYPEIKETVSLYTIPTGYKYIVVITIALDGSLDTFKSHEIADKLEKELNLLDFVHLAIIHVNPIKIENKNN